jgi:2-polyprenyl-3-methyl-5-hydroxy-6-metoxy-1,4-benzoquinol methylase
MDIEVRQRFALALLKGDRILDVGCSDGRLIKWLNGEGRSAKGVEIDHEKASICAKEGLDVVEGNIESMETSNLGSFDTIFMTDVIEHLNDPGGALKKLAHNLNTGGRVVITTPNVDWLLWHIYHLLGGTPHAWINPEHTKFYNKKTLTEDLRKAGYEIVAENSIGKIPKTNVHFKSPATFLTCNIVVAAEPRNICSSQG